MGIKSEPAKTIIVQWIRILISGISWRCEVKPPFVSASLIYNALFLLNRKAFRFLTFVLMNQHNTSEGINESCGIT